MDKIFKKRLIVILTLIVALASCRKKEFDAYYGRPDNLEPPIYQQLQTMGTFSNFLACVDKAGYKGSLSAAGSWTVFAPNDEAFAAYFKDNNLSGLEGISEDLAKRIVRYSMIYNGETIDRLGYYLGTTGGWDDNNMNTAFRRRTLYYDFVQDGKDANGRNIKIINANRNGSFIATDFNNKNVPYFFEAYMGRNGLTEADYKYFYPTSTYSGLNVGPANILPGQKNLIAENGVIHVVDRVLVAPLSIDQYIQTKADYSDFNSLVNKFVQYSPSPEITRNYQVLTGKTDSVYIKLYSGALLYSPNNENYLKVNANDVNDAQQGMYSIIAPNNAAFKDYAKKVLLKYYPAGTKVEDLYLLNGGILTNFINAHLYTRALWPSKVNNTTNPLVSTPGIDINADIVDKQSLSNGFFYGSNKILKANIFHTVFGHAYLDPKYSLMVRALTLNGFDLTLKLPSSRFMFVMVSDKVLAAMGFSYDAYLPKTPIRFNGADGAVLFKRILQTHIIPLDGTYVPDLNGTGLLKTLGNEFVKYANGRLISAGTLDSAIVAKQSIRIDSIRSASVGNGLATNGSVVYTTGLLSPSSATIGTIIAKSAQTTTSPYYKFYQYLFNSELFNKTTGEVNGVSLGLNYTFLIPTNAAIDAAIAAKLLPASPTSTVALDITNVTRFIQYHILKNESNPAVAIIRKSTGDGNGEGTHETMYKNLDGVFVTVRVADNTALGFTVYDAQGRAARTILSNSNVLSDRKLIHQIDTYLNYNQ